MGINEIIMYIMMFFMLIAAVDRILSQFGGSARFLGKFGKSIEGSGGQFEEGFMAMGALGLAMVGMTALAPVLAHVLGPVIIPVYEMLGANPSMFAGTLLACEPTICSRLAVRGLLRRQISSCAACAHAP